MAIAGSNLNDRHTFGERLSKLVFPSQPIDRIEYLFGRKRELDRIERALFAGGRHIFIYGDRGVGKSSLAATAAFQYQSADNSPIFVGCGPNATFASVVANIAYEAAKVSRIHAVTTSATAGLAWKYFSIESGKTQAVRNLHDEIRTVSDAVAVLDEVARIHSDKPIVVLDEFDRMNAADRNLFADLLKQCGDKHTPIKTIITGVGDSLEGLLGAHESAIRQLDTIELGRLSWEGRWEIVQKACNAFGIDIGRDIYVRIAAISDGFPSYVHLVVEKMLWRVFDDPGLVDRVSKTHYQSGVLDAVESVDAELKRPYTRAINQRAADYEEVLWSTADGEFLHQYADQMYAAYKRIIAQIPGKVPLSPEKYRARLRALKKSTCGEILVSEGNKGLYTYREKMLRGYVRMQAEANGVQLAGAEPEGDKQYMRTPARANTGYYQSTPPPGVRTDRRRG